MPVTLRTADLGQPDREGWQSVTLQTGEGPVETLWHPVAGARAAVIWGGAGGGFDSPANNLYGRLGQALEAYGVASLRVRYRHPQQLRDAVADVRAGAAFLLKNGVERIGLVGHSLGGAVMVQVACLTRDVGALVLLASQTHGATALSQLGPRCPVLLVHGDADAELPAACSESLFGMARYPKRLEIIHGAGHGLEESPEQTEALTRAWLLAHLLPRT